MSCSSGILRTVEGRPTSTDSSKNRPQHLGNLGAWALQAKNRADCNSKAIILLKLLPKPHYFIRAYPLGCFW